MSAEEYIKIHKLRELSEEWIRKAAEAQPADPLEFILQQITETKKAKMNYVTCENAWCEVQMPEEDYEAHLTICSPTKWNKCIRCNQRVDVAKMPQHRQNCRMVGCPSCGEYVYPLMLQWCPKTLLARVNLKFTSPGEPLLPILENVDKTPPRVNATFDPKSMKVKQLQSIWRSYAARHKFQNLAFRVVWGMMDIARETRLAKGTASVSLLNNSQSWKQGSIRVSGTSPTQPALQVLNRTGSELLSLEAQIQSIHPKSELLDILQTVEQGQLIEAAIAEDLVHDACKILALRPTVVEVNTPYNGETIVVGDLHGQLKDLMYILKSVGLPSEKRYFIFNGDFVDRGSYGCEVLFIIFSLLCCFPRYVYLNRGNHEDRKSNQEYGFEIEVNAKYDEYQDFYNDIVKVYKVMPLVHILDKKVMIVHGGVPRKIVPIQRLCHIGHIKDIPTVEQTDDDEELMVDLTWSDPVDHFRSRHLGMRHQGKYWRTNTRGCGIEYLPEHTEEFLKYNNLSMVVRSHEVVPGGYHVQHNSKSVTVFSASDYCCISGNRGAIAIFSYMEEEPGYKTWYLTAETMVKSVNMEQSPPTRQLTEKIVDEQSVDFTNLELSPSDAQFHSLMPGKEQQDCLRQIRELIWGNRHRLMSYFCSADFDQTGYISKVEWCEIMRKTTDLQLPWYFLCCKFAETKLYKDIPSISYTSFLCSVDSKCGRKFQHEWTMEKIREIFSPMDLPDDLIPPKKEIKKENLKMSNPAFGPSHMVLYAGGGGPKARRWTVTPQNMDSDSESVASHQDDSWRRTKINYNKFVALLRGKSRAAAALSDNELFVIFIFFDADRDGIVCLEDMIDLIEVIIESSEAEVTVTVNDQLEAKNERAKGWLFTSLVQLQQFFLTNMNRGLISTFKIIDTDGSGTIEFDEFRKIMKRLNKQLAHPLDEAQMEQLFLCIDADGNHRVDLQEFLDYFSVDLRVERKRKGYVQRKKDGISPQRRDMMGGSVSESTISGK